MQLFNLKKIIKDRGFLADVIELPRDNAHWSITLLLISLAYLLSFWVRLEWIDFAQAHYLKDDGTVEYLRPDMVKNGVALPNTHDSFYFGSILQKAHLGMHAENKLIPSVYENGMITYLPYLFLKVFPSLEIETLLLWLPVCIAGLVCIPIVLIGRLYGSSLWGFLAACLAGVTHSYYNRTLAGYYDTDMFSITVPAFALYFLLAASRRESLNYLIAGVLVLYSSRFFYGSIQAITCSMALTFLSLRWGIVILEYYLSQESSNKSSISGLLKLKSFNFACKATILISWVLYAESWSLGRSLQANPERFFVGLFLPLIIFILYKFLEQKKPDSLIQEKFTAEKDKIKNEPSTSFFQIKGLIQFFSFILIFLLVIGVTPFLNIGPFSGTWSKITGKLESYAVISGTSKANSTAKVTGYSLNFKDVKTTIREASEIPPEVVRNRILADSPSCSCPRCLSAKEKENAFIFQTAFLGFLGMLILVFRYWEMCLILPFAAIAYYCFSGSVGLRFTVHVGNAAALGLVFIILTLLWFSIKKLIRSDSLQYGKLGTWIASACFVCFFIMPNIQHAKNYNSHVVYPIETINVLNKLNEASSPEDFTITWWDYGSGCWFYGETRTFTSPAHQTFDNFLTSEILRSTSEQRAVNLSRLKTETYLEINNREKNKQTNYSTAVQAMFKDGTDNVVFYPGLLNDISLGKLPLPNKTVDNFLFLPYEILRIFPTILSFSSRNLFFPELTSTQATVREPPILKLENGRREGNSVVFDGGYRIDRRGILRIFGKSSGIIPYGQILEVSLDGLPAKTVDLISLDGLQIPSNPNQNASRKLLYVKDKKEILILSAETYRSTFAKRFLLNGLDLEAYDHPNFVSSIFPKNQPYMAQADWITQNGRTLSLNMRGGYRIEVDLEKNLATIPGADQPVPFNFHRVTNKPDGSLLKIPTKKIPNARFHLVQANIPVFLGGRSYEVPEGGKSLKEIAKIHGIDPMSLSTSTKKSLDHNFDSLSKLEIPAKGYELRPAFFFMDDEVFSSILVQGFLMEDLDEKYFEKVFASPWGKVYKMLN